MNFTIVNKCLCLVAKRNSGKSELLRYMVMCEREAFKKIYVLCPSESVNNFYSDFVPKKQIFDSYREDWVNTLIKEMTKINKGRDKNRLEHVLLILDDIAADVNFNQSKSLKILFARSRHIGISVIITCQYLHLVPPIVRNNTDFLAVGQLNHQGLQILKDDFMLGSISREEFEKQYYKSTSDYNFLLINNTSVLNNDDLNLIYGKIKTPTEYIKNL